MSKNAETDAPIVNTLAVRWSPVAFSDEPVASADLKSLFEAARWAPSSYNEQPWRYIVGLKGEGETHRRILDCLAEGNQPWARNAPVLALGVVMRNFSANGKPNKAAPHDLGLATGNLVTEDLVWMLESMGLDTGVDIERLIAAREVLLAGLPGETLYGHVADAGLPLGFEYANQARAAT